MPYKRYKHRRKYQTKRYLSRCYPRRRYRRSRLPRLYPMKPEIKRIFREIDDTQDDLDIAGEVNLLNGVATGTTALNKLGINYKMISAYIKFNVTAGLDTDSSEYQPSIIRVLLVLDKQSNGATVTLSDVLTIGSGDTPTKAIMAFSNKPNAKRFKILRDKTYNLNNDRPEYTTKWFFKQPKIVQMQGTAADVANMKKNALYLIAYSDSTVTDDVKPSWTWKSQVNFTDS